MIVQKPCCSSSFSLSPLSACFSLRTAHVKQGKDFTLEKELAHNRQAYRVAYARPVFTDDVKHDEPLGVPRLESTWRGNTSSQRLRRRVSRRSALWRERRVLHDHAERWETAKNFYVSTVGYRRYNGVSLLHGVQPQELFIFLMAKTTLNRVDQVHFLLLKRDAGREEQIAKFLKKQQLYRRETKRETSVSGSVVLRSVEKVQVATEGSKRAWKRCFPDGKPNDFCSDTCSGGRAFVNVMFWHKVQVQHLGEVEKQGYKFPPSEGNVGKSPWLEKLLERYPDERMRYHYQEDEARVRMLWIGRNERERSEFETEKSIF